MANFGAYACCKLCFCDIYASTTCFFVSSTLQMERGVFNRLSEAKKTQFLTGNWSFFFAICREKRQNFGTYGCCKLCFSALCLPTSCFLASSTLKKGGEGSSTACVGPKTINFDQKTAIFGRFFMKHGKFWYIQMLQIVFSLSVCPHNLLLHIQHPQNGWGFCECLSGAEKLNL